MITLTTGGHVLLSPFKCVSFSNEDRNYELFTVDEKGWFIWPVAIKMHKLVLLKESAK